MKLLNRKVFLERIIRLRRFIEYKINPADELSFKFPIWNIIDFNNHPFNQYD